MDAVMTAAEVQANLDVVWTLVAAILVFTMQAGFAMVESGFARAKNAANIMMKNLMDFAAGSLAFYVLGAALMFGASAACGWLTMTVRRNASRSAARASRPQRTTSRRKASIAASS